MSGRPPRWARAWVALVTRRIDRDAVLQDLLDEFLALQREGATSGEARRWYRLQALGSTLPLLRTRLRGLGERVGSPGVSTIDIRLGLRMLRRHPGLSVVAVFALAVGIPVGLAPMHSAAVFEAPVDVPEGDRLRILKNYDPVASDWVPSSSDQYEAWRTGTRSFEGLGMVVRARYNVNEGLPGDPTIEGAEATATAFALLRVPPLLGRLPSVADERPGAPAVVVVSHDLWRDRLAGDVGVVGRTLRIGGVPHEVVGVMPAGFHFPYRAHLWLPLRRAESGADDPRAAIVFGRLADGVTPEAAQIELTALGSVEEVEAPDREADLRPILMPFTAGLFGLSPGGLRAEQGFYVVQMLALLVLVVACVNIAMLILVRTTARSGEFAVRAALGADRTRLVAQLFIEAFVLAAAACGIGLLVADQAAQRLDFLSRLLPSWMDLGVTPRTTLYALLLAALSAVVVGVVPALKVTGRSLQGTIQRAAAARTGVRFGGLSSALVVADVALAVVAVSAAIIASDQASKLESGAATLAADRYLVAGVTIPPGPLTTPERVRDAQRGLRERLEAEPGVRAVAVADVLPGMDRRNRRYEVAGTGPEAVHEEHAWTVEALPGFFAAFEQPLVSGRGFRPSDVEGERAVAIVTPDFVTRVFEGRNPLGRRIRIKGRGTAPDGPWLEIVGVAPEIRRSPSDRAGGPGVYLPAPAGALPTVRFAIALDDDPTAFVPRLRELANAVDPGTLLAEPMVLRDVQSFDGNVIEWMILGVKVMIGILIALAASGTYALMSFTVSQREREIAVRSALGSPRSGVLATIARRALMQLGVGVTLGMAATGGLFMVAVSNGWRSAYPLTLLVAASGLTVVLVVGGLACVGPTRKGLAIQPGRALRD